MRPQLAMSSFQERPIGSEHFKPDPRNTSKEASHRPGSSFGDGDRGHLRTGSMSDEFWRRTEKSSSALPVEVKPSGSFAPEPITRGRRRGKEVESMRGRSPGRGSAAGGVHMPLVIKHASPTSSGAWPIGGEQTSNGREARSWHYTPNMSPRGWRQRPQSLFSPLISVPGTQLLSSPGNAFGGRRGRWSAAAPDDDAEFHSDDDGAQSPCRGLNEEIRRRVVKGGAAPVDEYTLLVQDEEEEEAINRQMLHNETLLGMTSALLGDEYVAAPSHFVGLQSEYLVRCSQWRTTAYAAIPVSKYEEQWAHVSPAPILVECDVVTVSDESRVSPEALAPLNGLAVPLIDHMGNAVEYQWLNPPRGEARPYTEEEAAISRLEERIQVEIARLESRMSLPNSAAQPQRHCQLGEEWV